MNEMLKQKIIVDLELISRQARNSDAVCMLTSTIPRLLDMFAQHQDKACQYRAAEVLRDIHAIYIGKLKGAGKKLPAAVKKIDPEKTDFIW